jgi:hypothetical protein
MRQRRLPNVRPLLGIRLKVAIAPVLTVLGVVILALSVFGFVQSSGRLAVLTATCPGVSRCPEKVQFARDMQQINRSLSAAGFVVGGSSVATGLFFLLWRRAGGQASRW